MAFIYKITNDVNGKIYIGKTLHNVDKRWKEHINDSKREHTENRPLYRAMNKYGIDNFHIETIEECSDELVEEREVFWIKEYNSFGKNGYNATIGGDGKPYVHRALILWLWLGNMNITEVARITLYDKGTISKTLKSYGVTSKEISDRASRSPINATKSVAMLDMESNFIKKFSSIADACVYLHKNPRSPHIGEVCKGKRKTAYGFKWKFL